VQGICRRNFLSRTSDDSNYDNANVDDQDEKEYKFEVEDNYARSTRVHTNGNVGKHFKKSKRNSQLVATNATYAGTCPEPAAKKITRILQCKLCLTVIYSHCCKKIGSKKKCLFFKTTKNIRQESKTFTNIKSVKQFLILQMK